MKNGNDLWIPPVPPREQGKISQQLEPWQQRWAKRIGFREKTVWDWLQFLANIAVPILIAVATILVSNLQNQVNQNQRLGEVRVAEDKREDEILKAYIDNISDLLLNRNLRNSKEGEEVNNIARGQTLIAIQRLRYINGGARKARILQFLHELRLVERGNKILSLRDAWLRYTDMTATRSDLTGDDLSRLDLESANLSHTLMMNIDLSNSDLSNSNLSDVVMDGANLSGANLRNTILNNTDLRGAIVSNEQLAKVKSLQGATMPDGSKHP